MDLMENLAWMDFTWVCVMYCFIFKPNQRIGYREERSFVSRFVERETIVQRNAIYLVMDTLYF